MMINKILIALIERYQQKFSSHLGNKGINCKFYPTCSEYTKQALQKYGTIKGCILGIIRILKCNPFSKGGYDPLK